MLLKVFKRLVCGQNSSKDPLQASAEVPFNDNVDIRRDFDLKDILGVPGTFGECRIGIRRANGKEFAIKIIKSAHHLENAIRTECDILKILNHPNVCHAMGFYSWKKKVYIVMEKYTGGDLFDVVLAQGGRCSEDFAKGIVKQTLCGLQYLHSMGIAHCDVKLSNIMFQDGIPKLIDFGVSQFVTEELLHAEVGSPSFIAPEVLMGSYNEMCDMWSFGVVVFILLFGFNPFNPHARPAMQMRTQICEAVLKGFSPVTRKGFGAFFPGSIPVSAEAKDFISHLLTLDWHNRLTASEALKHPWLSSSS